MLEIGKEYIVRHQRKKGTFRMRVGWQGGSFVRGIVTEGETQAITKKYTMGMEITMRKSLASFEEVS